MVDALRLVYDHWFLTCLFIATAGFWGFWIAVAKYVGGRVK